MPPFQSIISNSEVTLAIVFYIFVAILILMLMITIHELGHYLAAKMLKIQVTEFSIGFGKAIFKRTSKKTGEVFAIRMIPLGGYCAFADEDAAGSGFTKKKEEPIALVEKTEPNAIQEEKMWHQQNYQQSSGIKIEKSTNDKKLFTYTEAAPWRRLIVLFSGAFFNFVSAIIFSVILLMIVGYTQGVMINTLTQNSASWGVITPGDTILAVNGQEFTLLRGFGAVMSQFSAGDTVTLRILCGATGEILEGVNTQVTLATLADGRPGLGVYLNTAQIVYQPMGFFSAIGRAFLFSFELAWVILTFLWLLVSGQLGLSGIGGPISTVSVMAANISSDFINIFLLLPLISVNLAVFNLLPIPALDGARMIFVGVEWVRRKPINPEIEGRIHMVGLIILMGLVLLADMNFLFGGGRGALELLGRWLL